MYLFKLTFFRNYLHSPKTWLHGIKFEKKIAFFILTLLYLPYLNLTFMMLMILISIAIFITLKIPKQSIMYSLFTIIILITMTCFYNTYYLNYNQYPQIYIYIPKKIKNYRMIGISHKFFLSWEFYLLKIPIFILRISIIYISYLIYMQILFLTTTYEYIILFFLIPISQINNQIIKQLILIFALSAQFLELIIEKLNKLIITIKLRGLTNVFAYELQDIFKVKLF